MNKEQLSFRDHLKKIIERFLEQENKFKYEIVPKRWSLEEHFAFSLSSVLVGNAIFERDAEARLSSLRALEQLRTREKISPSRYTECLNNIFFKSKYDDIVREAIRLLEQES